MATSTVRPRDAENESLVEEGKHIAKLVSSRNIQTKGGASGIGLAFELRKGGKFEETLWDSPKAQARMIAVANRMGAEIDDDEDEAEIDWDEFNGNEYVVEVKNEEYEGRKRSKMTYCGIWPLNHEDVTEFVAKQKGGKPSNGKPAKVAAGMNVDDV